MTGAGAGIGRQVAARLAARGYLVIATDRNGADVELDVRDPAAHRAVAERAAKAGRLAVWVNNAGVLWVADGWGGEDEQVRAMVEVNLLGVIHGCRAALSVMTGRADVVNLASMAAFGPVPGLAVYAATKAAVASYTVSLAADLRAVRSKVRVHALCPDPVDTGMVRAVAGNPKAYLQFSAPRMLAAEEVAEAAVGLVGSRRIVRSLPAWRGAVARGSGLAPRSAMPLLPVLRKIAERRAAQRP
ncbi:MAG TPA: SDR family NAD(P)-dependent oxidoreductase [Mycobacteriales bacterium]|nr:SDR family NAD(P)-dependent oxidoreductase [Mycobacteriales bacterium]